VFWNYSVNSYYTLKMQWFCSSEATAVLDLSRKGHVHGQEIALGKADSD